MRTLHFFAKEQTASKELTESRASLLKQLDFALFQQQSLELIKKYNDEATHLQWQLFCNHVKQLNETKAEKMLLMQTAFLCLENPLEQSDLAQLLTLFRHLKAVDGLQLIQILLQAKVPTAQRQLGTYLAVLQLLIDLYELPGIVKTVRETLPQLNGLFEKLQTLQTEHLALKYPQRDLDAVIDRFAQHDELVQCPLPPEELAVMKQDYKAINTILFTLKSLPEAALQDTLEKCAIAWKDNKDLAAKQQMVAIIAETIRRKYSILPYDTQILSLLALINTPEKLKGRIAQIKTGEGKSTIIAMLSAFMGAQGYFVDMVTSAGYLAQRDCKKYQPFYTALGLSVSHISHQDPKQKHFHAQILYGTNTDFEFSYLRDGLYNRQLRRSRRFDGELIERPFEVVIIDEVDNLFLDVALSSAQLSIRDHNAIFWIYEPVFRFVQSKPKDISLTPELIRQLRDLLAQYCADKPAEYLEQLANFSDEQLKRQFESAHTAHFEKQKNKDYLVAFRKDKPITEENEPEIIIVDYLYTGRTREGCQWQHGIHQYLQIKENLKLTPSTKTAASISHPTFFTLYQYVSGLTGTMGETIERQEVQAIYKVDSFDVPPHYPSQRLRGVDFILPNKMSKWDHCIQLIKDLKQKETPALVLFKSIQESNDFSDYTRGVQHQLLNDIQCEAEEYLIARAGEPGMTTLATNVACRGMDIILAPQSKEKGGLQVIFTFFPDNLRVESQGFGRAGRQGQPGGCWMVLDAEDEAICNLMKSDPDFQLQLSSHLLQQENTNPISAEPMIHRLNELRSARIQDESVKRSECTIKEQSYFKKLQAFFSQMAKVHALVEDKSFKNQMIQRCVSGSFHTENPPTLDEKNPDWIALKENAKLLLNQAQQGVAVDWSAFANQFSTTYLHHIRSLWGSYYSKLTDPIETKLDKECAFQEVDAYLLAPEKRAESFLGALFSDETFELNDKQILSFASF